MEEQHRADAVGLALDRQHAPPIEDPPLAVPQAVAPAISWRRWWERVRVAKIALFFASLYLFVLAISLMKEGARAVVPLVQNLLTVTGTANALGFGWLFSYIIMSGSPVAAAAITFFDAGVVDELGAFAMITGSRLGASFVVLLLGFLYILRGRDRATSLSMGLLSLLVTATTYLPALPVGLLILRAGVLDRVRLSTGALLRSAVDLAIEPVVGLATGLFPQWLVFVAGLGVILVSFSLFDKCLPQMSLKESQVGWMSRLVYRPAVMFALGALITMISMSVSLSLSILVPLSNRGFVRRENVIPYIMGANITTFVDTLLAAVLLDNGLAFTVVFVQMFSVAAISAAVLMVSYRRYQQVLLRTVSWVTASTGHLAAFLACIFVVPLFLMLI